MSFPHPLQVQQSGRCPFTFGQVHHLSTSARVISYLFFTPSIYAGGGSVMMKKPSKSRHSVQTTWSCEHFCSAHSFPVDPTPDTPSFYAVYSAHYIKPDSVSSYLFGICNQLEPFFPEVQTSRLHWLVKKTLAGC